jgi:DnaJ-class molecular chaperone
VGTGVLQRGDLILTFEVKYPKSLPEHVRKKVRTAFAE